MFKKYISVDAFGGDKSPDVVIGGINQFLFQSSDSKEVFFYIFGNKKKLLNLITKKYPRVLASCEIVHTEDVIKGNDKVSNVIRHAFNTSMYNAIKYVREGKADAVVSAGNTGVLMALSKLTLKTIDGISRPAITTMLPSGEGDSRVVVLDLGANVHCDAENLLDFSILGSVYANIIGKIKKPKLGILNIGEEETKGNDVLQRLNKILIKYKKDLPYNYVGFVEGNDISGGKVEVVVTDGFTGNIVLKTVEGTAKLIKRVISENIKKSLLAIIGSFFLVHVFKRLKHKIDPRSYAGAVFLGLNGFVIKTHGNSDVLAFANAIQYAFNLTKSDFYKNIKNTVKKIADIKKEIKEE